MSPNRPIRDRAICLAGKGSQEGGYQTIESRWPPTNRPCQLTNAGRTAGTRFGTQRWNIPVIPHGDPGESTRGIFPLLRCEPLRSHISVREVAGLSVAFCRPFCAPMPEGHFLGVKCSHRPAADGSHSSLQGLTHSEQEPSFGAGTDTGAFSEVSLCPSMDFI